MEVERTYGTHMVMGRTQGGTHGDGMDIWDTRGDGTDARDTHGDETDTWDMRRTHGTHGDRLGHMGHRVIMRTVTGDCGMYIRVSRDGMDTLDTTM